VCLAAYQKNNDSNYLFFQSKKILIHCYYHFTSMLTHFKRKIWFLLNLLKYVLFMFLTRHEEHQGLYFVVCISVTYYYLFVLCYKGLIWVWISFILTHLRSRKQFKKTRTFKLSTQCEQTSAFCKDCVSQSHYVTLCVFNNVKGILHFFFGKYAHFTTPPELNCWVWPFLNPFSRSLVLAVPLLAYSIHHWSAQDHYHFSPKKCQSVSIFFLFKT